MMNFNIEGEEFDIKYEENVLPKYEIKIEPQESRNEIVTQEEECDNSESICEPEHVNIKSEIQLSPHPEVDDTKEDLENTFTDYYNKKGQESKKNAENRTDVRPANNEVCETYGTDYEDKCGVCTCDHRGEKTCQSTFCKNSSSKLHYPTTSIQTVEKLVTCNNCSKSFVYKSILTADMHLHTSKNIFTCYSCSKICNVAKTASILPNHIPYKCNICGKYFSQKSNLAAHTRTHTGEKPFTCSFCSKSFSQKYQLTIHLRMHTGEKPFRCSICTKSFAQKSKLTIHMIIHTGDKPFACNICKKLFSQKSKLAAHMRIHTDGNPFTCNVCSKSFSDKYDLTRHMRVHTDEKPYMCSVCSKSFSHKCHVVRHMSVHTGEKPFICNLCSKSFANKSNFIKHSRVHAVEKVVCEVCGRSFSDKSQLNRHVLLHNI